MECAQALPERLFVSHLSVKIGSQGGGIDLQVGYKVSQSVNLIRKKSLPSSISRKILFRMHSTLTPQICLYECSIQDHFFCESIGIHLRYSYSSIEYSKEKKIDIISGLWAPAY